MPSLAHRLLFRIQHMLPLWRDHISTLHRAISTPRLVSYDVTVTSISLRCFTVYLGTVMTPANSAGKLVHSMLTFAASSSCLVLVLWASPRIYRWFGTFNASIRGTHAYAWAGRTVHNSCAMRGARALLAQHLIRSVSPTAPSRLLAHRLFVPTRTAPACWVLTSTPWRLIPCPDRASLCADEQPWTSSCQFWHAAFHDGDAVQATLRLGSGNGRMP